MRCKAGDLFRVSDQVRLNFSRGVIAVEAQASFEPRNRVEKRPPIMRLKRETPQPRATLLRDPAMSVEIWRLPQHSRLEPDGETCHALMALTPGVIIDGRELVRGEAVFIPACARSIQLFGRGSEVLVAYPDVVPTAIWRVAPEPDPAAAALRRPVASSVAPGFAHATVQPPSLSAAA
jgi:hypothetical protein